MGGANSRKHRRITLDARDAAATRFDDLFDGASRGRSRLATVCHNINIPKNNRALSLWKNNDVGRLGHDLRGKAIAAWRNVTNHDLELVSMFVDSVYNDPISAVWL